MTADDSDPARRRLLAAAGWVALLGGCATTASTPERARKLGFTAVGEAAGAALRLPAGYAVTPIALPAAATAGGLQYVPLDGARRGLLAVTHDGGGEPATAEPALGVGLVEIAAGRAGWQVVAASKLARRIDAQTPCALAGPAARHVLMRTAADPTGVRVLGTVGDRGLALSPWGTVLAGEATWARRFDGPDAPTADQRRWGLGRTGEGRWAAVDTRFDARRHPNEFHRFGWLVEVDPLDTSAVPVKRTAIGRAAHAGVAVAQARAGQAVVYHGDAAAQGALYKFVSRDRVVPGGAKANAGLLDNGTLHVARLAPDGSGRWLPLVHGSGPLVPANGFADAAEVAIKTRQAADRVGATVLDNPAGVAVDGARGEGCCALGGDAAGAPLLCWNEGGGDPGAESFAWRHAVRGGPPPTAYVAALDPAGVVWFADGGALYALDPGSGAARRFAVAPTGAAIGGVAWTPDGRTLFVAARQPGAPAGQPALFAVRRADGGAIGA